MYWVWKIVPCVLAIGVMATLCAASSDAKDCIDLNSLLGNQDQKPLNWSPREEQGQEESAEIDPSMATAVGREIYDYFTQVYQLEAQLKIAQMQKRMLESQPNPNLKQMRSVLEKISALQLQMEMANIDLQEQVSSILPQEQFASWRRQWRNATAQPSPADLQGASQITAALSLILGWMRTTMDATPSCGTQNQNYIQMLPQQSLRRAEATLGK